MHGIPLKWLFDECLWTQHLISYVLNWTGAPALLFSALTRESLVSYSFSLWPVLRLRFCLRQNDAANGKSFPTKLAFFRFQTNTQKMSDCYRRYYRLRTQNVYLIPVFSSSDHPQAQATPLDEQHISVQMGTFLWKKRKKKQPSTIFLLLVGISAMKNRNE